MNDDRNHGPTLLAEINAIRSARHMAPVAGLPLEDGVPWDPSRHPLARVLSGTITGGTAPGWERELTYNPAGPCDIQAVGDAVGQPIDRDTHEARISHAMLSFLIAFDHGLTFADEHGLLRGWIDPSEDDPTTWKLHLMPGVPYPEGHAPPPAKWSARQASPIPATCPNSDSALRTTPTGHRRPGAS